MRISKQDFVDRMMKFGVSEKKSEKVEKKLGQEYTDKNKYSDAAYEILGVFSQTKKSNINNTIKNVMSDISENKIGTYEMKCFDTIRDQIKFFEKEAEINIEEGVSKCKKCGSKKCLIVPRQQRSLDEPATLYTICVKCNYRSKKND